MTRGRVDLFVDCISPCTHISLHLWARYAKVWPVALKLRPMLVLPRSQQQPMRSARAAYELQDLARSASLYDVPLVLTPWQHLPESAAQVRRLLCAAQLSGATDSQLLALAVACSDCLHVDLATRSGPALTIDDAFLDGVCSRAELEVGSMCELIHGEKVDKLLSSNTQQAVQKGAFGSPTAFVFVAERPGKPESEGMFVGSDRMEQLAHHLSLPYGGACP